MDAIKAKPNSVVEEMISHLFDAIELQKRKFDNLQSRLEPVMRDTSGEIHPEKNPQESLSRIATQIRNATDEIMNLNLKIDAFIDRLEI